jgi:uncharacterized protein
MQPSLTVSGNGTSRATPDLATVRLGVVADAPTAVEAQNKANVIADRLIEKILGLKVPKTDVQTSNLMLSPIYANPRPGQDQPTISGYRAQNTLSVRLTNLTLVGKVIDAGVSVGSNNVEGVDFGLRSDIVATREALKDAIRDARAKADAMAEALGIELDLILEIQEGGARIMPPQPLAYGRAMDMAATKVMPGQVEVGASVTIRYGTKQKRGD